ncbi:hypothetical protein AGMMS49573_01400 [Endomicrobiia bacterium]|nr:hypothetical protein AGMMS49573_01400 [Endomicrobiia bacterium]
MLKILIFAVRLLRRILAQFWGCVAYYLIPIRKKDMLKNIALSFPEKSKKEVDFITKNVYKMFIEVRIDMFFISNMPDVGDEEKDIYIINFYNKRLEEIICQNLE